MLPLADVMTIGLDGCAEIVHLGVQMGDLVLTKENE